MGVLCWTVVCYWNHCTKRWHNLFHYIRGIFFSATLAEPPTSRGGNTETSTPSLLCQFKVFKLEEWHDKNVTRWLFNTVEWLETDLCVVVTKEAPHASVLCSQSVQRPSLCVTPCQRQHLLDWPWICPPSWPGPSPTWSARSASTRLTAAGTRSLKPCWATARASWTRWPKTASWTSSLGYRLVCWKELLSADL